MALGALLLFNSAASAQLRESVVTVLADFEDDSIAPSIGDVQGTAPADCAVKPALIPARGQRCLAIEVGATANNAYAACDLTFRMVTTFSQADRISVFCWVKKRGAGVAFRIRDARGQVFETPVRPLKEFDRWVRVEFDLAQENLRRIAEASPPRGRPLPASQPASPWAEFGDHQIAWPIELRGLRVTTQEMGQHVLYVDDICVEHRVEPSETVRGDFAFDKPTKIYQPGSTIAAKVELENRSRTKAIRVAVELAWLLPDGTTLKTQTGNVQLPASGVDYRARQAIDFSLKIAEPGLYKLVARAREATWPRANTFETTIAVMPSNRNLPRGRSTFLGLRSNLLREPSVDQILEIDVVREIGAHLLAIDTPWRLIEPKRDAFVFAALDPLVARLASRGIAIMLVLTDPPEWLTEEPAARLGRQGLLFEALAAHFADQVQFYQPLPIDPNGAGTADVSAVAELQKRVAAVRPSVRIVSPATRVLGAAPMIALPAADAAGQAEWAFASDGATDAARRALLLFGGEAGWTERQRWFHTAAPLAGSGSPADAADVLAFYLDAAAAGVAGLVWYDLRDDDNDAANSAAQNGLLQRDFSPKATLWGFASAVGMLTGLRHAGAVHGAPESYAASLFVGGDRQVALLRPLPNRIQPAVLAPIRGVGGGFSAQDFERRTLRLLESDAPPLLVPADGPMAVTLTLETAQPQPQIGFGPPWLRVPAMVFADPDAPFTIEIVAPLKLQRSYLQIALPDGAPFESSVAARQLKGEPGETIAVDVLLTPKRDAAFERGSLTLKFVLEGKTIEVPIEVRPARRVRAAPKDGQVAAADFRIGALTSAADERVSASVELNAGWQANEIRLVVVVDDDIVTPDDRLLLGVALENSDAAYEIALTDGPSGPVATRAFASDGQVLDGWQVTSDVPKEGGRRTWNVRIPASAFGAERLSAERHLLIAARYSDVDEIGRSAHVLSFGSGLDGSRSTAGFVWLRLKPGAP